jgi:ABC-2 type transport system ATP-binding protein
MKTQISGVRRTDRYPQQESCLGSNTQASAIEVNDLDVVRGKKTVLHGISVNVPAGAITGLLGPSGSGKTTLLRSIVGVQRISGGTVNVLGLPAASPALRQKVGYVTQSPSVYEDVTVLQNVRYFASLYGRRLRDPRDVLAVVGLSDQANQLVSSLSGGQRSRCSLACALVADPKVLVLDEPTAGQDPLVREQLWEQFSALARSGVAVIVSSHVMAEAGRCDRLLMIREGRVTAEGTPDQLRAQTGHDDMDDVFLALARTQEVT